MPLALLCLFLLKLVEVCRCSLLSLEHIRQMLLNRQASTKFSTSSELYLRRFKQCRGLGCLFMKKNSDNNFESVCKLDEFDLCKMHRELFFDVLGRHNDGIWHA
mmetsp:Transcript_3338/g.7355  ORF Transcript_3338/g.7355 Transcript_3338/m.7355 type:complete len:104 (-) Transcript_3338:340-651(-)